MLLVERRPPTRSRVFRQSPKPSHLPTPPFKTINPPQFMQFIGPANVLPRNSEALSEP
jgi:hypothetical protein